VAGGIGGRDERQHVGEARGAAVRAGKEPGFAPGSNAAQSPP
jgi:hypothetical protein